MALENSQIAAPSRVESTLDERVVKVSIEINGKIKTYENLFISAVGVRYANPLQDEAEITLYNLDKATQEYILTQTSPYNANYSPKTVILEAGRKSYGTTVIYRGNVVYAGVTQPPDIGIILKCMSGNYLKNSIIARNQPAASTLEQVSRAVAQDAALNLNFHATNKEISNYGYAGSALNQIAALASLGNISVFIDNDTLVVKDLMSATGGKFKKVSASTGMIGIPELTERGTRVKFFIDNKTVLGGGIDLQSEIYPTVNGYYIIYQLAFIITNRMLPFYYIADCSWVGPLNNEATNG